MMKSLDDFHLVYPMQVSKPSNLSLYMKLWYIYIFCALFLGKLQNFCSNVVNLVLSGGGFGNWIERSETDRGGVDVFPVNSKGRQSYSKENLGLRSALQQEALRMSLYCKSIYFFLPLLHFPQLCNHHCPFREKKEKKTGFSSLSLGPFNWFSLVPKVIFLK